MRRNPQVIEKAGMIALDVLTDQRVMDRIVFLDLKTGKPFAREYPDAVSSPVILDQDLIYGTSNVLIRVNVLTGKVVWSIPVDSTYQSFPDGS
jgi:hypothetical protein